MNCIFKYTPTYTYYGPLAKCTRNRSAIKLLDLCLSLVCIKFNYTLYKNPGFWLVNSRCIFFCVFSYLGLILFIFTAARVFVWGFNFFPLCAVVFAKTYFTFLPSSALNRQIHSEYFFFTFICKVTWLIKFETRECSDVNVKTVKKMSDNSMARYYLFSQCSK